MLSETLSGDLPIVVGLMAERTGLWQITHARVMMLRRSSPALSVRSKAAVEDMINAANRGEKFWQPTVDHFFALNEIKSKTLRVDKTAIDKAITEVAVNAKRDGVGHREWVRNVLELLTRLSSER